MLLIGYPTIWRASPPWLDVRRMRDLPVVLSMPRSTTLLLLCDPLNSRSQPMFSLFTSCALIWSSCPQFCVDPMLRRGFSCAAPDDPAKLTAISASFVFLL